MKIQLSLILSAGALAATTTDPFRSDNRKLLQSVSSLQIEADTVESESSAVGNEVALSKIEELQGSGPKDRSARSLIALGGSWNQVGDDILGGDGDYAYATSISGNGNRIVIGAYANDNYCNNCGLVRVYDKSETGWVQVGSDIHGMNPGDGCGYPVSISDDSNIIVVGERYYDGDGKKSRGRVRVFHFVGDDWTLLGGETDIVGESAYDYFGRMISLSTDGKTIIVGSYDADRNGSINAGYAAVYNFDDSSWNQVGDSVVGVNLNDMVGTSVDVSSNGTIVAIGSRNVARIFEVKTEGLEQLGDDFSGNSDSFLAVSLSSDGSKVAIGVRYGLNNSRIGEASVFEYGATGWSQLGNTLYGEEMNDQFGYRVSLSSDGRTIAVGARDHDTNSGIDSGYVRVFTFGDSDWTQAGSDIEGKAVQSNFGGYSLELSSDGATLVASGRKGYDYVVRVYNYQAPSTTPPTSPPTVAPVSKDMSEYINAASKAFQITADTGSVSFSQGDKDGEIAYNLKVSQPAADEDTLVPDLSVFWLDCKTPISAPDIVNATHDGVINGTVEIDGAIFDVRPVIVDVDVTKIASELGIFKYLENGTKGQLQFCVKADIGTIVVGNSKSSISFVKVLFDILLNMKESFSNAGYEVSIEESTAVGEGDVSNVDVDYELFACQCTVADKQCINGPVNQNDPFAVCIKTDSTDVIIKGLQLLNFVQDSLSYEVVKDSVVKDPSITSMSAFDSNEEVVVSRMLSVFYNGGPASVEVQGTALLEFADGSSRQLTSFGRAAVAARELQDVGNEGEGSFLVNVELGYSVDVDEASASLPVVAFSGSLAAFMVVMVAMM
mmetsp:Transcript_4412/g.6428  ORF Transcript_4412/g.6428 Transcript_4412/m.6428 type:complete len:836 (-) Transcript_4412:442-2949(-)